MAKFNDQFQLSIEDMEIIEGALRREETALSNRSLEGEDPGEREADMRAGADDSLRQIHDLLGRLHNQKVFYRPASEPYIGG